MSKEKIDINDIRSIPHFYIVTKYAKDIFKLNRYELYAIHDDKSESLIITIEDIDEALKCNEEIGVESYIGIDNLIELYNEQIK